MQLIRQLDHLLGKPACLGLSGLDRFARPLRTSPPGPPRKILFVKLIEMGSTVLAGPALREAERMVGADNVYMMVFASNRAIIDLLPQVSADNVIAVDDRDLPRFLVSFRRALARIRELDIDTAIDLEGLTRSSAIITRLTGAPRRVGFYNFRGEGPYRGRLFTHELQYSFQHHTAELFLALTRAAAERPTGEPLQKMPLPDEPLRPPRFEPTATQRASVLAMVRDGLGLSDHAPLPSPLVILNPNLADTLPLRTWPAARFTELGRRLLEEQPGLHILLTGNRHEIDATARLAATIGPPERVASVAGRTDLGELVTLYGLCDLLVSTDSGPCHFATMTDIHVVALFGPETAALYGPLGPRATSISARLACSPCLTVLNHRLSHCKRNRCMEAIAVDTVFEAAIAALGERAQRPDGA